MVGYQVKLLKKVISMFTWCNSVWKASLETHATALEDLGHVTCIYLADAISILKIVSINLDNFQCGQKLVELLQFKAMKVRSALARTFQRTTQTSYAARKSHRHLRRNGTEVRVENNSIHQQTVSQWYPVPISGIINAKIHDKTKKPKQKKSVISERCLNRNPIDFNPIVDEGSFTSFKKGHTAMAMCAIIGTQITVTKFATQLQERSGCKSIQFASHKC